MMVQILKNLAWGFLVYVLVMMAEALVTLPWPPQEGVDPNLAREFALTAPLALIISTTVAYLIRTAPEHATARALTWAGLSLALYLVIGIGNDTLRFFSWWALALLILMVFAGPIVAARLGARRLSAHSGRHRTA